MSTGAIVGIVVGALVLIALLVLLTRAARNRRLEGRREQAAEVREDAQSRTLRANRQRAAADEQAARAKQAQAEAEEKAATARRESATAEERAQLADRERRLADERHEEARSIDPDVTDNGDHEAAGDGESVRTSAERRD
jgi:flagellar biosynthesis/type III secretory pathway M-ring protein FliF/YscJ